MSVFLRDILRQSGPLESCSWMGTSSHIRLSVEECRVDSHLTYFYLVHKTHRLSDDELLLRTPNFSLALMFADEEYDKL